MQGYSYSIFSAVAIAIHLIINFNMLIGRKGLPTKRGVCYRWFLGGVLFYYVADALWGVFAGLGWTRALYVETAFFFLSLVAFVFLWGRFAVVYLGFGKRVARFLDWCGYALLAFNLAAIAANPFNNCFYHIDAGGQYLAGPARDIAFVFLIAFNALGAAFALAKAVAGKDALRRRSMMVLISYVTMSVAIVLNVVWPLTPFTALGCLIVNCFFQVFVVQDEQAAKHAAELEKALERARAAEKARSMFFSIVSHDIRTPLNAILGYAELLQNGMDSQPDRDLALKSIRASGTTLLQLVNDVLDLAKMDAGKMVLQPEPVKLDRLADEVFSSFWLGASEKGIKLENHTDGVPVVMIDGHRLRQILFNLVGNAVKFTNKGFVEVRASFLADVATTPPSSRGAIGTLLIEVSDTGCGIPSDMLERVLDPFVQVIDPSHSADRAGGTGLGLSICRRLVETMGGELDVKSELGKGSTFRITLPGVAAARAEKEAMEGIEGIGENPFALSRSSLPHRVLVVDDSPVNRKVLVAFLKKAGIARIDEACDGGEALEALDSAAKALEPHDFVLSDFWMPNMNGLELAEKIRSDSRFASLSVWAVTADSEFKRDERNKLFSGVLLKPVTYDKLMEVLHNNPPSPRLRRAGQLTTND